jgi:hypothetical protein
MCFQLLLYNSKNIQQIRINVEQSTNEVDPQEIEIEQDLHFLLKLA